MKAIPQFHPACAIYPDLPEDELAALAADIKANGLHEPITLTSDGLLLDGKNRWRACARIDVEPATTVYDGDPFRFVLSKNHHRRHESYEAKAFAADAVATLSAGRRWEKITFVKTEVIPVGRAEAAAAFGIAKSAIDDARAVRKYGGPEMVAKVKSGAAKLQATARQLQAQAKTAKPRSKSRGAPVQITGTDAYLKLQVATDEETGRPPPGASDKEHLDWRDEVGFVPIHSTLGKQLLASQEAVNGVLFALLTLKQAKSRFSDEDAFFEHVERCLAHRPRHDTENGEQVDVAKDARELLKQLALCAPLIRRLTAYVERMQLLTGRPAAIHSNGASAPP
jgi:hypothetical protein